MRENIGRHFHGYTKEFLAALQKQDVSSGQKQLPFCGANQIHSFSSTFYRKHVDAETTVEFLRCSVQYVKHVRTRDKTNANSSLTHTADLTHTCENLCLIHTFPKPHRCRTHLCWLSDCAVLSPPKKSIR